MESPCVHAGEDVNLLAKFRQLINIHGRQSAIIIVTVTDDLPVQSGSKKPG
ncbi:hypothetical protein [Microcoleus sp.]|uniref:hypothetical protein n=1 Tax=Microcoleus sp. TaxID=44472 RepID=UPI00403E811E